MPSIYAQCFIGLRLTANDGNANTVQEMEAMRIPVVHNFSNYGLKWKNVDDIIKHILNKAPKQKREKHDMVNIPVADIVFTPVSLLDKAPKQKREKHDMVNIPVADIVFTPVSLLDKAPKKKNINANRKSYKISDYKCINIENKRNFLDLMNNMNGDNINETNFIKNIQDKNITLYFNNTFISGEKNLLPEISISRNKNYNEIINRNNVFINPIPYIKEANGLYFITQSMIDAIKDKSSLLYPHVYEKSLFNEINNKKFFLQEQHIQKKWYNWATEKEIKELKLRYFPENAFVICICGRIAINSYPKSLFEAIKILRGQGHNIQVLALAEIRLDPYRLTKSLYDEINGYDWVKSFTVDKKDVLNYFRTCDILASTYRDYCNHVGGSNKIKEYLLCNKPILCSRGKERERELGKNYPGFYDCKTCDTVPPLCWTREYIQNPNCYIKQYNKYFKNIDMNGRIKTEINYIKGYIKTHLIKRTIIAVVPVYGREPLLKYTIRRLYEKNKINHVVVIGDSKSEEEIALEEGAIFLKHKNLPLGKKWNAGYSYVKKFNPDALLFVGSSDWVSSDWIDRAYAEILNGAGYVGKSGFDMVDITNKQPRYCKWYGYISDRKKETIGIGRLVSRKLLEAINYKPFPENKNKSMDYEMYLHCIKNKMSIKILENNSIFLSVSCDLWKNMHVFNMHYYGCSDYADQYYNKNRSKNIKYSNYCNDDDEIAFYHDYKELFKNGSIYTTKEINLLHKKFPELNKFINDYLKIKK